MYWLQIFVLCLLKLDYVKHISHDISTTRRLENVKDFFMEVVEETRTILIKRMNVKRDVAAQVKHTLRFILTEL